MVEQRDSRTERKKVGEKAGRRRQRLREEKEEG